VSVLDTTADIPVFVDLSYLSHSPSLPFHHQCLIMRRRLINRCPRGMSARLLPLSTCFMALQTCTRFFVAPRGTRKKNSLRNLSPDQNPKSCVAVPEVFCNRTVPTQLAWNACREGSKTNPSSPKPRNADVAQKDRSKKTPTARRAWTVPKDTTSRTRTNHSASRASLENTNTV